MPPKKGCSPQSPQLYTAPLHWATCLLFHHSIITYLQGHSGMLAAVSGEQDVNPDCSSELGFVVALDKQVVYPLVRKDS